MEMPSDKNPMPEIHLFPRLEKIASFVSKLIHRAHEEVDDYVHPLDRPVTQYHEKTNLWD